MALFEAAPKPSSVDFWFDPGCPFTWRTSRWISDVSARRGIPVRWHLMSLAVLNEGKEIPEQYRAMVQRNVGVLRVLAAAAEADPESLPKLYSAVGRRAHEEGRDLGDVAIVESLADAGLPADLAAAQRDAGYDQAIRASHATGQARVGTESGSPVTALAQGPGFFGPVVVPIPTGEDALALFDALVLLSGVPSFSELKRSRADF